MPTTGHENDDPLDDDFDFLSEEGDGSAAPRKNARAIDPHLDQTLNINPPAKLPVIRQPVPISQSGPNLSPAERAAQGSKPRAQPAATAQQATDDIDEDFGFLDETQSHSSQVNSKVLPPVEPVSLGRSSKNEFGQNWNEGFHDYEDEEPRRKPLWLALVGVGVLAVAGFVGFQSGVFNSGSPDSLADNTTGSNATGTDVAGQSPSSSSVAEQFRSELARIEGLVANGEFESANAAIDGLDTRVFGYGQPEFTALREQIQARDTGNALEAEKQQLAAEAVLADRQRIAEEERLAAETAQQATESRLAIEAEQAREATEARLALEAAQARQAEEARLAAEAEAEQARQAEQVRLAAEAEQARQAEEARLAAEAEQARQAEELRLAAEAEARAATEARLAAEAEQARQAEELRLAAEAEARAATEARLAEEERVEEARLAAEARAAEEARQRRAAETERAAEARRAEESRQLTAERRRERERLEAVAAEQRANARSAAADRASQRSGQRAAAVAPSANDREATDRLASSATQGAVAPRRGISDAEISQIDSRLQAVKEAIRARNMTRLTALTNIDGSRVQAFYQLFTNSSQIDIRVDGSRAQANVGVVVGTLQISRVLGSDGSVRAVPSNLRNFTLTTRREGDEWSKFSW